MSFLSAGWYPSLAPPKFRPDLKVRISMLYWCIWIHAMYQFQCDAVPLLFRAELYLFYSIC